jgi:hypothetical protein
MLPSSIVKAYQHLPAPLRKPLSRLKRSADELSLKMKIKPIRLDSCLLGSDNGISGASFARMTGDLRHGSRPISEWPHVKLLRQFDEMDAELWEPAIFEGTEYYQNAVTNIEYLGVYYGAVVPEEIQAGARSFVEEYRGIRPGDANAPVKVRPVKDSSCYLVEEGHHKLAIAFMKGLREVQGVIATNAVSTPVQSLLGDVLWLKGKKELYQPVNSPELERWVTVRRCTDRFAKMAKFLESEGITPAADYSYLDVACSYGWFVSAMTTAGFQAQGVERDPIALSVGRAMYGNRADQVHRSDAVGFLQQLKSDGEKIDIVSCFSLVHHFVVHKFNVSAEEVIQLLDSVAGRVLFYDMGESHEDFFSDRFVGWNPDHIEKWLKANTTFTRIVRLGVDEDAVPPFERDYGRMLFACIR